MKGTVLFSAYNLLFHLNFQKILVGTTVAVLVIYRILFATFFSGACNGPVLEGQYFLR